MNSKYTLGESKYFQDINKTLYRVIAAKDFGREDFPVKIGDVGGWIEKESNLSEHGDCWLFNESRAFSGSRVYGNAVILNSSAAYGNSIIYDDSIVLNGKIFGNAMVFRNSKIANGEIIEGDTRIGSRQK